MDIYGVLLVFNDDYRQSSISAFQRFMDNFGSDCRIIVVNNNLHHISKGELPGDNTNWEFSGWDKGINALDIKDDDVVVFANDTFLHHRSWGRHDQLRFKKSILKLMDGNHQGICGEVHRFSGIYQVFGEQSDHWVCTYLFALSGAVINQLKNISLSESRLSRAVSIGEDKKLIWSDDVSVNLQARIQRWLYPPRGVLGWKKGSVADDEVKLRKAKTILNEKWLTAFCHSNGLAVVDAGPDPVTKFYRNSRYRMREVVNKVKIRIGWSKS